MPELSGIIQNYLEGSISTIGRAPVIQSKSITENGTYTAPEGVDGYSPVTVNVPQPVIQSKSITENGTYTAPEGVDGYSPITVNVATSQPVIQSKSITENGTYTAPEGVDGYSPIIVNVPSTTLYTLNVTQNGTYDIESGSAWNEVIVNVASGASIIVNKEELVSSGVLQTISCDFTSGNYYGFVIYDDYLYSRNNNTLACGLFKRTNNASDTIFFNYSNTLRAGIATSSTFTLQSKMDSDTVTSYITIFELGNNIINSVMPS